MQNEIETTVSLKVTGYVNTCRERQMRRFPSFLAVMERKIDSRCAGKKVLRNVSQGKTYVYLFFQ